MCYPKVTGFIGALFLGALFSIFVTPQVSLAQVLISDAEAKLPQAQESGMATRGITRGPGIEVVSPAIGTTNVKSPIPLEIKFIGRNNVAVDPATVKLTYVKFPTVDLTDRVKSYVTKDGLKMDAAVVPPGNHVLRLEVRDTEGRSATSTITLSVAP